MDAQVTEWTRRQLPDIAGWNNPTAIGIAAGNDPIAGIVYSGYSGPDIRMSIASTDPRWCSRARLRVLFAYPFLQLGCRRVTGICREDNMKSRRLMERLGFRLEGDHPHLFKDCDGMSFGMLKKDCRWIGGPDVTR